MKPSADERRRRAGVVDDLDRLRQHVEERDRDDDAAGERDHRRQLAREAQRRVAHPRASSMTVSEREGDRDPVHAQRAQSAVDVELVTLGAEAVATLRAPPATARRRARSPRPIRTRCRRGGGGVPGGSARTRRRRAGGLDAPRRGAARPSGRSSRGRATARACARGRTRSTTVNEPVLRGDRVEDGAALRRHACVVGEAERVHVPSSVAENDSHSQPVSRRRTAEACARINRFVGKRLSIALALLPLALAPRSRRGRVVGAGRRRDVAGVRPQGDRPRPGRSGRRAPSRRPSTRSRSANAGAYPSADVVSWGGSVASASASPGQTATANAAAEVSSLTLFGGEVHGDLDQGRRAGPRERDGGVRRLHRRGDRQPHRSRPGRRRSRRTHASRSATGATAILLAQGSSPEPKAYRGNVTALDIRLTVDHGGLPAGTQILVGYAEAAVTVARAADDDRNDDRSGARPRSRRRAGSPRSRPSRTASRR